MTLDRHQRRALGPLKNHPHSTELVSDVQSRGSISALESTAGCTVCPCRAGMCTGQHGSARVTGLTERP